MSAREVLSCDYCHKDLQPGSRRFIVDVVLQGLNGEDKTEKFHGDCCSAECCLAVMNDLVRKVS